MSITAQFRPDVTIQARLPWWPWGKAMRLRENRRRELMTVRKRQERPAYTTEWRI
jgi:hypothetical protein